MHPDAPHTVPIAMPVMARRAVVAALCLALVSCAAGASRAPQPARPSSVCPRPGDAAQPARSNDDGELVAVRIATFNIQQLGPTKAGRPEVMAKLAAIIARYDLVAVQEIKDRHGAVPGKLLEAVNTVAGGRFGMLLSPRTGCQPDDRRSQEQYAYYYRTDLLTPRGEHGLFDDSAHDYFQREPHVARFYLMRACAELVLINVHTRPRAAVREIAAIEQVFEWARATHTSAVHFVALGDFNAGCGYASEADLDALPLHGQQYDWVVPHSADTNLAGSRCPYDRIVVRSPRGSLLVRDWGVDHAFEDRRISDHYPVWATLVFPGECGTSKGVNSGARLR